MGQIIEAVDLFCGAGGTSTGLLAALEEMGEQVHLADTRKLRSEWRRAEAWLKDQEAAL